MERPSPLRSCPELPAPLQREAGRRAGQYLVHVKHFCKPSKRFSKQTSKKGDLLVVGPAVAEPVVAAAGIAETLQIVRRRCG